MNLKNLFDEDRAVSPVIGVILMVAITVILAAVIGTFVLGLGDRVSTSTPSASFAFDYTDNENLDELEASHNGGDSLTRSNVQVSVSGSEGNSNIDGTYDWSNLSTGSGDIAAGSTATVDNSTLETANNLSAGAISQVNLAPASVDVVWSSSEGDSSAVLGSWSGPQA